MIIIRNERRMRESNNWEPAGIDTAVNFFYHNYNQSLFVAGLGNGFSFRMEARPKRLNPSVLEMSAGGRNDALVVGFRHVRKVSVMRRDSDTVTSVSLLMKDGASLIFTV